MRRQAVLGVAAGVSVFLASAVLGGMVSDEPAPGEIVLVSTDSGEAFKGRLISADAQTVIIEHATLGQLSFPRTQMLGMRGAPSPDEVKRAAAPAASPEAPQPAPAAEPAPAPPPAPAPEVNQDPESFFQGWKGTAELGLNGAAGNSENFAARVGFGLKREVETMVTSLAFSYNYGTSDGDKNTDRGRLDLRNDWKLTPSRWRVFVQGSVEYDQFQDWDWRTTAFAGVAYELIKTEKILFLPKAGIGATKEFGGSDNRIRPEALGGFDFEYKIKDGHRLFVNFDSFWNLLDTPQYRLLTLAGYEILLDQDSGMALKLGIEDRYQSNPGANKKKNDLLYFATLVWNF